MKLNIWSRLTGTQRQTLDKCGDAAEAEKLLRGMGFSLDERDEPRMDDEMLDDVYGGAASRESGKTVTMGFWCERFAGKEADSRKICYNCRHSTGWGSLAFIGQPGICTVRSADDAGHSAK